MGRQGEEVLEAPPLGLLALWLADWAGDGRTILHVARGERRARALQAAIHGLVPKFEVLLLPPWDRPPYDRAAPSRGTIGERMACLRRLGQPAEAAGRVVLTTIDAAMQRLPAREALAGGTFRLAAGERFDLEALRAFLDEVGYVLDERVDEAGEAALRGNAIDLFPADAAGPYRLELAEERIVQIRAFDPLTQRSLAEVPALVLGSAVEPQPPAATLFDHLPEARLVLDPGVEQRCRSFVEEVSEAYAARRALPTPEAEAGPLLEPQHLYLAEEEWQAQARAHERLLLAEPAGDASGRLPRWRAERDPRAAFAAFLRRRLRDGDRVVLAAADAASRRRLARLAERAAGRRAAAVAGWAEAMALPSGELALLAADLPEGFAAPGVVLVAANDLLERRAAADCAATESALMAASEPRPGDHVVHADHGIGILRGLETVPEEEAASEYLALEYAGGDRKLVPVLEMGRLWRYGSAEAAVSLDRLDGGSWQARRAEVEAEIARTAEALQELAAARRHRQGSALKPPANTFARFVARFPFTETDDQLRAIEAALADLARGAPPMDRLVCGDVGFGKTEVALRAAAAAALAGKQVALLAPTTLLVRQHLETFRRRFAGTGVEVAQLSRLAHSKEAQAVRAGLADGSVRIVIGTHALASPAVCFKDLGLVVIDEEQRFGTRHKAALRRLRREAHVLTMSATPIPRTLQAALAGIQDLSVLATPPVKRQPVRTFVLPFAPSTVRDALLRERRRGGRSFVVAPRIADLGPLAQRLAEIVPELDIVAAHGRMPADRLDDIVLAFADGAHDVLLTTSIIETGLDIPGANTMIVWRAERFGLAQLHQLRGRVGRGRERAAVYLLHDPETRLPPATERRLKTLETLEGLGAGFAVSLRDLDLRGAGDLLGEEQAGHVKLVGTGLYQHLLAHALAKARGEPVPNDLSPELRLGVSLAIPADYVPEPEVRLELYGRLARLAALDEVDDLDEEIADRFGPPPEPVRQLLTVAAIRLRCREAGIAMLEAGPKAVAATFQSPAAVVRRLADANGPLRWSEPRLILDRESGSAEARLAAADELLDRVQDAEPDAAG